MQSQPVLQNVSLSIPVGQSCAIVGPSGSGKSTLLSLIGLLDIPTSGQILLKGTDMSRCTSDVRAVTRNRCIGFIFQSFNLLPRFSALENVALPLLYRGVSRKIAKESAFKQLSKVGLSERVHHRPSELSGGQRQRVAIARALVGEPSLLLADEPTGNLDSNTASDIIELLLDLNTTLGTTLVMITHDNKIAQHMERCVRVCDGKLWDTRSD
ncbi:ABC transporter ATP-binding protein [Citrobacter sp. R56]|uniref:ABC transporter ATP-binding protein n=1 Tax=Citrobacter sp. R56 TaxID=1573676 RepID=UPI00193C200E|nr:ABC transporter ATP-binding protein [Citrobacter sp. R56]QRG81200.1 ABC transporter ATP-binding protein [Citrobacter sp. R56]